MLLYCRYVFEKILIILEETMKKTKIICTMGPNTNDRNLIKDLALAGMILQDLIFLMVTMRSRQEDLP